MVGGSDGSSATNERCISRLCCVFSRLLISVARPRFLDGCGFGLKIREGTSFFLPYSFFSLLQSNGKGFICWEPGKNQEKVESLKIL